MKQTVLMKRELFGYEIRQNNQNEFFSATDLVNAGNKIRNANKQSDFNLSAYLNNKQTKEFIIELDAKFNTSIIKGRGRNSTTWVHPLLFIDIALAIDSKLKLEVYEWLFDNLIKYRNDSGDSYKQMAAALYLRYNNKRDFPDFISKVANYIKEKLKVINWETANELQLKKRDLIHNSIKLLSSIMTDPRQIVRIAVVENTKDL